jgi:hypothetical protein
LLLLRAEAAYELLRRDPDVDGVELLAVVVRDAPRGAGRKLLSRQLGPRRRRRSDLAAGRAVVVWPPAELAVIEEQRGLPKLRRPFERI